ncbi:mediator of RNA polymerase II transcription subunit 7-like [Teleopsis dalmanni]|uniref:mediator of RNA polymerase II transcription subunit 7-like n=1 Tax=Teleopsis dalmanni TaxID=139649 RepID=UPI0018CF6AC4|nr:mediator of RNA polymerase II transcription subunit 7-like [Teleopsis dalmanni]
MMNQSIISNSSNDNDDSMPNPPIQYISLYTDDNIRANCAPAPPPPIHGIYQSFGMFVDPKETVPVSLENNKIKRIIPVHFDRREEMKKLNMSICISYLDMLDVLGTDDNEEILKQKLKDIEYLFIHFHHLINEMRPHQARETLRVMMELQKRQRVVTLLSFQETMVQVWNMIKNIFPDFDIDDPTDYSNADSQLRNATECNNLLREEKAAREKYLQELEDIKSQGCSKSSSQYKENADKIINTSAVVSDKKKPTYLEEVMAKHDKAMSVFNTLKNQEQIKEQTKYIYKTEDSAQLKEKMQHNKPSLLSVKSLSQKISVENGYKNVIESTNEPASKRFKYNNEMNKQNGFYSLTKFDEIMCTLLDAMD